MSRQTPTSEQLATTTEELLRRYQSAIADSPVLGDVLEYDIRSLSKLQSQLQTETIAMDGGDDGNAEFSVRGILTAADTTTKTFQFSVEGVGEIKGTFEDAIDQARPASIPCIYTARMRRSSQVGLAQDEVQIHFFLVSLE